MSLSEEQWREHRRKAIPVADLGLCSVLDCGYVKIEGHVPILAKNAHDYKYTLRLSQQKEFEQFLVRNGIPLPR